MFSARYLAERKTIMTINFLSPALIFIVAAVLIPFFKGPLRNVVMLAVPILSLGSILGLPAGDYAVYSFMNVDLVFGHVDALSRIFAIIFHIISFISIIYMLKIGKGLEFSSAFFYAGAAFGVLFAGDLLSFFVFWELLTIGSIGLILSGQSKRAFGAAYRYVLMHGIGGLILFAGVVMHWIETGSIAVAQMSLTGFGGWLIFIGLGINAAWPLLHSWLSDAYPEASIAGTVILSAFTTKVAVYALARMFPGTELLIWIGMIMAIFPLIYAVIENDLRRVLAYALINQLGFMMVGIGIGTELAINGVAALAFNHILYKSVYFMSVGAVMYRTGSAKATDLGGLYKRMPLTTLFCIVASLSSFPLFGGFVTKSLVQSAALYGHEYLAWFVLLFATAGVFLVAGIKVPYFAFFSKDAGHEVEEAPRSMLIAMGLGSALCLLLGLFPQYLYKMLPYSVYYEPYTLAHVLAQLQLLAFSGLAFALLVLAGLYPSEKRAINLDIDLIYRKGFSAINQGIAWIANGLNSQADRMIHQKLVSAVANFSKNGVPTLLSRGLSLIWIGTGMPESTRKKYYRLLDKRILLGSLPVAIIVVVAMLYFVLLYTL